MNLGNDPRFFDEGMNRATLIDMKRLHPTPVVGEGACIVDGIEKRKEVREEFIHVQ